MTLRPLRAARFAVVLAAGCAHPAAHTPVVTPAAERCAIVPLRLVLAPPGSAPVTAISLAADGSVAIGLFSAPRTVGRLDTRGCLVAQGETWTEVTSQGDLWTSRATLRLVDGALQLEAGRAMRVGADGRVRVIAAHGAAASGEASTMAFEGFTERGRCAAHALLATFLGIMPSMAVSDGHPRMEPSPAGSLCPHGGD